MFVIVYIVVMSSLNKIAILSYLFLSSFTELRTRENSDVFNALDEIYVVFTSKK